MPTSDIPPTSCAYCGRPVAAAVYIGMYPYHPECTRGPSAPSPPYYTPVGAGDGNTYVPRHLTEADVRRIVREELQRAKQEGSNG